MLLAAVDIVSADDYGVWSNWRYVYLITNSGGANVTSGAAYNVPVVIRLSPTNFTGFASVSNTGADIRFAKTDGTHLPYAIERWSNIGTTNDTGVIWVLVDTVKANDTTKLIMYWNGGSAADSSYSERVFATGNGFQAVWHLSEAGAPATLYDATSNNIDGLQLGNAAQTPGRIGYGQTLDGTDDYLGLSSNTILNPGSSNFTISLWVKRGSTGSSQTIIGKTNGGNPSSSYGWLILFDPGNTLHFFAASGGAAWGDGGTFNFVSSGGISDITTWHHVVCVIDKSSSSNCRFYIDGANSTGSTYGNITGVGSITNTLNGRIGSEADGDVDMNGQVDEARYSTTTRSAEWIKINYQNQRLTSGRDSLVWFSPDFYQPPRYTWDNSTGAGYSASSNTWSTTDAYWSQTGTSLVAWPGSGNTAHFAGSDGNWTVTVSGTQYVDSIAFANGGYKVSGGTALYVSKKLSGAVFGFTPPWAAGLDTAKAFDGSISTYSDDNATDTGNTGIDLGAGNEEQVSYIRYYPRSGLSEYLDRMNGGIFQGSNDGSSWTNLYTISGAPTLAWQTVTVSNTTAWRYLRYLGPANGHCNVAEVEFYGMGSIYVASGKQDTIATVLAGNSGIRKYGAGYLTLSGSNTYTGPTEIFGDRLQPTTLANGGSNSGIGASTNSAANLVLDGGVLRYIGGTQTCDRLFTLGTSSGYIYASGSGTLNLTNTGSIAFTGSGTRTLELGGAYAGTNVFAPILGDGTGGATALTKTSTTCTWALTGTNTYTGATTVSAGTLSIGNGGTSGAVSNSTTIDVTGTLVFNRADNYTYSGVISGAGSITKEGAGTLTLSGNLTHSGTVTVNAGTLRLTGTPTSNARKHVINSGATISIPDRLCLSPVPGSYTADWVTLNGGTLSTGVLTDYGANRGFTLGASGGTFNIPNTDNANNVQLQGIITGSGALTKTGVGTLILSAANTYSGITTISAGTLQVGNGGTSGEIPGNITNNATLTFNRSNSYTYGGVISGTGAVTKSGAGALTLSGTNTYTGATTISAGSVLVTGSLASGSAVTVSSGATLGGTGTVSGTTGVSGTVSPGVSGTGTLTFANTLTFNSGSTFSVTANGTTAGTDYDRIVHPGTVSLGGNATLSFTLGYTPATNDAFTIISGATGITGTFSGVAEGGTITAMYNGVTYNLTVTYVGGAGGHDVKVTVASVNQEDYGSWAHQATFTLNTTATGANVANNVLKFPVLLRLDPGTFSFFPETQPNGKDIRFAKTNGTHLSYEIEFWKDYDNDSDSAAIWVKLDTVYGNNKTQAFVMYWGKSDAYDSSRSSSVFETSNGFLGVWHLDEEGTATTYYDKTSNGYNGTGVSTTTSTDVAAIIGNGVDLDGSTQCISSTGFTNSNQSYLTISAWIRLDNQSDWKDIISKETGDYGSAGFGLRRSLSDQFVFTFYNGGKRELTSATTFTDNGTTWYYVAGTYDGAAQRLYTNGSKTDSATGLSGAITGSTNALNIGRRVSSSDRYIDGILDEVVISGVARSADWIKLCYENQKTSQTLINYEDYSTWGFSRNITINTSGITTTNCLNFPLLVRLTSTSFDFNQARDNGEDIRFSKSDGTRQPYEIERWSKASSLAEIWVKVDTIYGSNSTQYIKMYWGKSGVTSRSSGSNVFDTANQFKAAYHLNENPADGASSIKDRTINGWNGTPNGSMDVNDRISGTVGHGMDFDGSNDYVSLGNIAIHNSTKYTVSMWINGGTGQTDRRYFSEGSNTDNDPLFCMGTDDGGVTAKAEPFIRDNNAVTELGQNTLPSTADVLNSTWNYITWVDTSDGSNYRPTWYVNGQASGTASYATKSSKSFTNSIIGGIMRATPAFFFTGQIDEVRLEKTARSADWIRLCYETQRSTPTIVTIDSADAFRPLGIRRYVSSGSLDSVYVGTSRWALRFAKNKGGGIKFLAADSTPANNQLDANLFYLVYNNAHSSDTGTGTLTLYDSSIVSARIRQDKTINGQPFTFDYSVLGSGKLYVRVSAVAASALSGGIEFRIANNATATYRNVSFGSTASTCKGLMHIDSGSGKFDIVMAPYESWSAADQITTNSKYTGLRGSTWSVPSGKRFSWEFMVDFGHRTLADSAAGYRYAADFRNSDTLGFYAGTPLLEQAWEQHQKGMWAFDEGTGNTVADKSGNGRSATISGTARWTNGKWFSRADSLGGSDSVTVSHNADFSGSTGAYTMMAWLQPATTLTSSMTIIKKYSSSNVGYKLTGSTDGHLMYSICNGGSSIDLESATDLSVRTWHHVAAKMFILGDQDFMALYIDGKLDTLRSVQLEQYLGTNSDALVIGKNFNGVVEDVRFFTENLTDEEIRAIYLKGFSPGRGMYLLRANNNNTVHCRMNGNPNSRYLPVFQIKNWWATSLPTYVYVDGVGLTSGTDYYAALDDNRNQLTIGFNRVVNGLSTFYIDDNHNEGYRRTGPMKRMFCGVQGASNQYFWVKNTEGSYFGPASANEFYMNWKMDTSSIKDGEIWQMRSSVTNPYTLIDTSVGTNLIQGDDGYYTDLGMYNIKISTNEIRTTVNVTNSFTYTVEESSQVRVRLRVNERQVSNTGSYRIVTRWTIYPTGQLFRYDSIYSLSAAPAAVYFGMYTDDQTYSTLSANKYKIRAINVNSQTYPDVVGAWLSMKNASGNQAYPFDGDTVTTAKDAARTGYDFTQYLTSPAKWNSTSIQTNVYADFHHAAMNSSSMDSMANGVQCSRFANRRALSMVTGTLDSTTNGDFSDGILAGNDGNGDGFNEMEGAYIVGASNNTVRFVLPAKGDTCRYYPAFRITGYTSVNRPQYVFLYKLGGSAATDTFALVEGYQFNSYVNQTSHELIVQIDSIFCDSVGIYISSDKTLAVKMSLFEARPGNRCDTLVWRTESEQENLGYRIEHRINPVFFDSVTRACARDDSMGRAADPAAEGVPQLVKRRFIKAADTGWTAVNSTLIPGAMAGVSYGPRDYRYIDRNLFNGILYEYRLIAVDYRQQEEAHGPITAMPRKVAPANFMLWINYPNPFRYTTRIRFDLPRESAVTLNIYTLQGRLVRRLIRADHRLPADQHAFVWDGNNDNGVRVAPGPYIYRLSSPDFVKSRLMLMIR